MKITLIRHGNSYQHSINEPENFNIFNPHLTQIGINQANKLTGSYDLTIISPLNRTLDTFKYSNIQTKKQIKVELFREHIHHKSDLLKEDEEIFESAETFENRIDQIKEFLQQIKNKNFKNICIISHSILIYYLIQSYKPDLNICLDYCNSYKLEI